MSEENVEVVRRVIEITEEGLRTGDFGAAFDQALAEGVITSNVEWRAGRRGGVGVAGLGDVAGREGHVEIMRTLTEDFEDFVTEYEVIDAEDNGVVVITSGHLTGKRSGVRVENRRGYIYMLEAGRIVRVTAFMELDHALKAAGLSE